MKIIKTAIIAIFLLQFNIASAQYLKLLDFTGTNGQYPYASLISDGTFLYGTTNYGGTNDSGVLFKMMPDGSGYNKLIDFTGTLNGRRPRGSLMFDGVYLYGTTSEGGTNDVGTIFKIKTDGTGYVKLFTFSSASGSGYSPIASLTSDGIFLYGMTLFGGLNSNGTIFKIKKDGTEFAKILDFAYLATGANPCDSLFFDGAFLYGTTLSGGVNNGHGVVFKVQTDGNGFTKMHDFGASNDGKNPRGSLISDGTFLYGTTREGGVSNKGTLFKIGIDGTGYTKLTDFATTGNPGIGPQSSLIFDGTDIYGMTTQGGANNRGIIFKVLPDGTNFTKLFDFDNNLGPNGSAPLGSLYKYGNILYGMASNGGISDKGTVFSYSLLPLAVQNNKPKSIFTISPNPTDGIISVSSLEKGLKEINAFNILGQNVYTEVFSDDNYEATIDLYFLEAGIYSLKISTTSGEMQTVKFIKQ